MFVTVDIILFIEYFGNCQVVEVYGRIYFVQGKKIYFSVGIECFYRGLVWVY